MRTLTIKLLSCILILVVLTLIIPACKGGGGNVETSGATTSTPAVSTVETSGLRATALLLPAAPISPVATRKPAEFSVESLEVSPASFISGTVLTITAKVTNVGETDGTYSARLNQDGAVVAEQAVQCAAGTSAAFELKANAGAAGSHTLELGGLSKIIEVKAQSNMKVKSLKITPELVMAGEEALIEAEIVNQGNVKELSTFSFSVNSLETESRSLELEAGQSGNLAFTLVRDAGKYNIKLGDSSLDMIVSAATDYSSGSFYYSLKYPSSWRKDANAAENVLFTGTGSEQLRITTSLLDVNLSLDDFVKQQNNAFYQNRSAFDPVSKGNLSKDNVVIGFRQDYSYTLNNSVYSGAGLFVKRGRYSFRIQGESKQEEWDKARPEIEAAIRTFEPPEVATGKYTNENNGFSLSLPQGWDGLVTGKKNPSLVVLNPQGQPLIITQILINNATGDMTAQKFLNTVVDQLKNSFQDIKIESQNEVNLGKETGYEIVFRANSTSYPIKGRLEAVIHSSQIFCILSEALSVTFEGQQKNIDGIFTSFAPSEPKPYGVSRQDSLFLLEGDIVTLDPALTEEGSGGITAALFSGLIQLDKDSQPIPDLAEKWETSSDRLTYTFHLHKNAVFASGKPVTAGDVKYSWERACDPATASPNASTYLGDIVGASDMLAGKTKEIGGIKVIDDQTLQVTIDGPKPYFLGKISQPCAFVIDRVDVARGSNWDSQPNGSGPFKIKQWTKGEVLILERNDSYYLGPAKLKNIVFRIFAGESVMMYENGEIDVTQVSVFNADKATDPKNPLNKELYTGQAMATGYISFNVNQAPFDDLKVRQAFAQALDMDKLLDVSYKGGAKRSKSLLPTGMPGYNPLLKQMPFDPEGARTLIGQSSYGSVDKLPPVTFYVAYGATPLQTAMAAMWKQNLGVDVKIEAMSELKEYQRRRQAREFQLFLGAWNADYLDPQNFLDVLFQSKSKDTFSGYSNPTVDSALAAAAIEQDSQKRLQMYQDIEKQILADLPCAPFFSNPKMMLLVKPYVKGFTLDQFVTSWKDISIIAH
jgi:oligopeptide transport system substrate-binding protein